MARRKGVYVVMEVVGEGQYKVWLPGVKDTADGVRQIKARGQDGQVLRVAKFTTEPMRVGVLIVEKKHLSEVAEDAPGAGTETGEPSVD